MKNKEVMLEQMFNLTDPYDLMERIENMTDKEIIQSLEKLETKKENSPLKNLVKLEVIVKEKFYGIHSPFSFS